MGRKLVGMWTCNCSSIRHYSVRSSYKVKEDQQTHMKTICSRWNVVRWSFGFYKVGFHCFRCKTMESFLKKYQWDEPLITFLCDDVTELITTLRSRSWSQNGLRMLNSINWKISISKMKKTWSPIQVSSPGTLLKRCAEGLEWKQMQDVRCSSIQGSMQPDAFEADHDKSAAQRQVTSCVQDRQIFEMPGSEWKRKTIGR